VGDYEFTTRQPQLGSIEYEDFIQIYGWILSKFLFIATFFFLVADIPGIVPGASKENQGLGSQFLRHIERCLALLLIIDMSVERPWEQYNLLMNELRDYKMDLTRKPITVIGNKMDDHDAKLQLEQTRERIPYPLLPISTIEKINIDKLLLYLRKQYDDLITDEWRDRIE
jgi:GTP-binding protein